MSPIVMCSSSSMHGTLVPSGSSLRRGHFIITLVICRRRLLERTGLGGLGGLGERELGGGGNCPVQ